MPSVPTPADLAGLMDFLRPLIDVAVDAALQRQLERSGQQGITFGIGRVTGSSGASVTFEPDDASPGYEQGATRVGGAAAVEGDNTLVLYGPRGEVYTIGSIPGPP